MSSVRLTIIGRVHGVFFRVSTREEAERLGITGFVRNLPEGSVEVVARGEVSLLQELIVFCRNNPGASRVQQIEVQWDHDERAQYKNFVILR